MTVQEEIDRWMGLIPATGDDREMFACQGAIAELRCYRDEEAETDDDRRRATAIIRALNRRWERLKYDEGD